MFADKKNLFFIQKTHIKKNKIKKVLKYNCTVKFDNKALKLIRFEFSIFLGMFSNNLIN